MKKIVIIGAGASGLMAAATILESEKNDYHIHLFEKNTIIGKKILISGGGRCNVTTAYNDKKILETKYTRGWHFIKKSMGKFSPKKCYDWFCDHGVPLKIEADNRVFPVSDDGNDIVSIFQNIFAKNRDKVSIHFGEGVTNVSIVSSFGTEGRIQDIGSLDPSFHSGGWEHSKSYRVNTSKGSYDADILLITTGGNAYSQTGSTGDGYAFARSLGHTITRLGPSLSSFLTREKWLHTLSGISFENARIGLLSGPLLLTHFGLSGPLAFMLSSKLAWEDIGKESPYPIYFSPLAEMGEKEWDQFLKKSFLESPKKLLSTVFSEKLSKRFSEAFIDEYFPSQASIFVGSLSRQLREDIAKFLGVGIPLTLLERRPGDEFVTAGGVDTAELDADTLESCIRNNLFFAGEILNVDGYTGGFSLQMCWASGFCAAKNIISRIAS